MPFVKDGRGRPSEFMDRLKEGAHFEEVDTVVLAIIPEKNKSKSDWNIQIERQCCGKVETVRSKALRERIKHAKENPSPYNILCRTCTLESQKKAREYTKAEQWIRTSGIPSHSHYADVWNTLALRHKKYP